jgi:hypothetical protein
MDEAKRGLQFLREVVVPHFPAVPVPEDWAVELCRKEHPLMFLTLMALAVTWQQRSSEPDYRKDYDRALAIHTWAHWSVLQRCLLFGFRSLELLHSAMILSFWYNEPEVLHRHKNNMISNFCFSFAHDLGLDGSRIGPLVYQMEPSHPQGGQKSPQAADPIQQLSWLSIYCASQDIILLMRDQVLSKWSLSHEMSCSIVEESELPPNRKRMVFDAELAHCIEDIMRELYPLTNMWNAKDIFGEQSSLLIDYFDARLDTLYEKVRQRDPEYLHSGFLAKYHVVLTLLHHGVMMTDYSDRLGRAPFLRASLAVDRSRLTPRQVQSFIKCYTSAVNALQYYVELPTETIEVLPYFELRNLVFCATMIMNVIVLTSCNKRYGSIRTDFRDSLPLVHKLLDHFMEIRDRHFFGNSVLSFEFVIVFLMCHCDRLIQYYSAGGHHQERGGTHALKYPLISIDSAELPPTELSQPKDVLRNVDQMMHYYGASRSQELRAGASADVPSSTTQIDPAKGEAAAGGTASGTAYPGSPLHVLSTVALDTERRDERGVRSGSNDSLLGAQDGPGVPLNLAYGEYSAGLFNDNIWDPLPEMDVFMFEVL